MKNRNYRSRKLFRIIMEKEQEVKHFMVWAAAMLICMMITACSSVEQESRQILQKKILGYFSSAEIPAKNLLYAMPERFALSGKMQMYME